MKKKLKWILIGTAAVIILFYLYLLMTAR